MATTLGGVALAEPKFGKEGYEIVATESGAMHYLADGSVAYDYVNSRWKATLRWGNITAAEKGTIQTRALIKTAQAFVGPNGDAFTAFVVPNSWRYSYEEDGGGTARYDCELQLEESTA
jgi:hypothetical protein